MKVAVIAGTPVDTQMGVDYLHRRDESIETVSMPSASDPRACHLFQIQDAAEKQSQMRKLFLEAMDQGIRHFFIYCNSLSSSVDFNALSRELGVKTVTPMMAYEHLAKCYHILGVLAANNQCTKGIEDHFTAGNRAGYIIGIGDLRLTEAVERRMPPQEIAERFHLKAACEFFEGSGCEAIVLGCTHFPWFQKELSALTALPVLDPADLMFEELICGESAT